MSRAQTPCVVCSTPASSTYCWRHGPDRSSTETTTRRGRGAQWQRTRRRVIDAWVAAHGWVCPGWQRPAHSVRPGSLECDHVVARANGGTDEPGNLAVLCGPCNRAKSAH